MINRAVVTRILDNTTLVVTSVSGSTLPFSEGAEIMVVGVGGPISAEITDRLVVPKARLTIISNAGSYAVAKASETRTQYVDKFERLFSFREPVERSVPLPVRESALKGNPGAEPVSVGDLVIASIDYADLVRELSSERA